MKLGFQFLLLLCTMCVFGCGKSDYAPVSGVITVNGKPTANIRIVFAPMGTQETNTPGPPSLAVTDAEGRYQLQTRTGDDGAVVGKHDVTFTYADLEPMGDLKIWLGSAESEEEAEVVKKKIKILEQEIASRGAISKSSKQTIDIAAEGTQNANFEVGQQAE